ncbi:MAG: RRXRR domain-containing protein [Deltaproteobacteria bacterium]|nr:RRXRR domain-containing protein [Deltaproteobacteria bacterium]
MPPSIRHLKHEHDKARTFIKSILPITSDAVEVNKFDFQKMENPDIKGKEYQNGPQKGFFDVREYVLHRDGYGCIACGKDVQRETHRIIWRFRGGTDRPKNLVTLCKDCHGKIEKGEIKYRQIYENYIWAARVNMLRKSWHGLVNISTENMVKARNELGLEKSHINDALSVCGAAFGVQADVDSIPDATSLTGRFVRRKNRKLHDANPKAGGYREPYNANRYLVNKVGVRLQKGDLVEYTTKDKRTVIGYVNTLFSRGVVRIADAGGRELYNGASINKVRKLQNTNGLLLAA